MIGASCRGHRQKWTRDITSVSAAFASTRAEEERVDARLGVHESQSMAAGESGVGAGGTPTQGLAIGLLGGP